MATQVQSFWIDLREALSSLPLLSRIVHIFWLLGPFILLIERTPADVWITLIGLFFVGRSLFRRDGHWLNVAWVRAAFLFWSACLITALYSPIPFYSFGEAFVWFRFPLFAMATVFWLAKDKRLLYAMLFSTALGSLTLCLILGAEFLIVGQQDGRLSWPYGDLVPGSYLAKTALPVFTAAVAMAVSQGGRVAASSAAFILISMIASLLTGERINFLIRSCSGMLAALVWRPKLNRIAIILAVEFSAITFAMISAPGVATRYISNFWEHLPTGVHSPYFTAMMPGVVAFQQRPIAGYGPGALRELCPDVIVNNPALVCHPHPHNFYIQLAGETGIFGLVAGTLFFGVILWTCFVAGVRHRDNVLTATAFIVPLSFFWPIASTADFFGQWNNIFMWSGLSLALAATNLVPESKSIGWSN